MAASASRLFAIFVITLALAACSSLPKSGPAGRSFAANAAVRVTSPNNAASIDYVLLELSRDNLAYFDDAAATSLRDGFNTGRGQPPAMNPNVGDIVEISIFEARSGGLFVPEQTNSGGNYVTLPAQTIDKNGFIDVPYAGKILLAGRSVSEVQQEIEDLLASRAIEPQVIITTTVSRSNRVSILGDVNSPSEVEVGPRGEKVLDVISRAGGLSAPGVETYVTVVRGSRQATAHFQSIVENPAENIFVFPGDTIYVNRERRTYLAFGATGANGRFDFEESDLTLGEALGKAGGLLDGRADPSQVYLYRIVARATLQKVGVDLREFQSDWIPVIFEADLTDPSMFFATQEFRMQDKDLLYVSNASSVDLTKFLNLISGVTGTAASVPINAVNGKNAFQQLTE